MKRGVLLAVVSIFSVAATLAVWYAPWLRTQAVQVYCDTSSEVISSSTTAPGCTPPRLFWPAPSPITLLFACNDGVDNDNDQWTDAADAGCHKDHNRYAAYLPYHTSESGEGECANGRDDDNDGRRDEDDYGCYDLTGSVSLEQAVLDNTRYRPSNKEAGEPECLNNRDDDGDGFTDEKDWGCYTNGVIIEAEFEYLHGQEANDPECGNRIDDDQDGRIDKADAGCYKDKNPLLEHVPTQTEAGEGICADGKDSDDDGDIDRADLGCYDLSKISNVAPEDLGFASFDEFYNHVISFGEWYRPNRNTEIGEPGCANGRDDDRDGAIDEKDPGCKDPESGVYDPFESESGDGVCDDGNDNDNDGLTDADDPGCHEGGHITGKVVDTRQETQHKQCSDGIDNDGDGRSDNADAGCHLGNNPNWRYSARDNNEAGERQCVDGRDNDGDGFTDEADPHCYLRGKVGASSRWIWLDNKEAPSD